MKHKKILTLISFFTISTAILSFFFLDKKIAIYFHDLHSRYTTIFSYLTYLGDSNWILICSLILFIILIKWQKKFAHQALFVFTTVATSGIFVNIIKVIFSRYRPKALFENGDFGFNLFAFKTKYLYVSFPSGHSVTSMAMAVALTLLFPRYKYIFFFVWILVALSRVIVTAHYLSDILIGGLIGAYFSYYLYYSYFFKKVK
jgi:membrane-associated phospholipid phosphatase